MTPIEQVVESANAVATINLNFQAVRGAYVGAFNQAASIDLTLGLYGGDWNGLVVASDTVTLTDDDTNYVVMAIADGTFSCATTTTNWDDDGAYKRLCVVPAADGEFDETDIEDWRFSPGGLFAGGAGGGTSVYRNASSALSTVSGVVDIDYSLGDYFTLSLSANVTSITLSNLPGSGKAASLMVQITQDSTPRTVAWPASFKWAGGSAPSVSSTSGAIDVLAITTFDNGTTWRATLAKAFA